MAKRSQAQKIGARGHKWLAAQIEEHPDWLSRELGEDFGIDMEAELTASGVTGEILKLQIKSVERAARHNGRVKLLIDSRYLNYAQACRYPVILVMVDLASKQAWYVWLQDWIVRRREISSEPLTSRARWTHWVLEAKTISAGLDGELRDIASWKGQTQLTLSLIDAIRAAGSTYQLDVVQSLVEIIERHAPTIADVSLDLMIEQAVLLGERLRATPEGNATARTLCDLAIKYGDRITTFTIETLVMRSESYSRVGLGVLSVLYNTHLEHLKQLQLPRHFAESHPDLAFYCAFRESSEGTKFLAVPPREFVYANLRFIEPEAFFNKFANRGASAILDYLVFVDGLKPV